MHNSVPLRIFARAGLWSAVAFVLNLAWEIAQVKLYTIWTEADRLSVARALLHCSLGDVLIALALFALVGLVLRRADWPASRPRAGGAIAVIGALAYTTWSEWYNVYRAGSWGYTASMPLIFGIGLSPLLQWLILPPILVLAYRTLGRGLFSQRSPMSSHESTRDRT
jgi:hypothetical protein